MDKSKQAVKAVLSIICCLTIVALFSAVFVPYAQASSGTLTGVVYDGRTGKRLQNVAITFKPQAYGYGNHDYMVTSGRKGKFEIDGMLANIYTSGGAIYWTNYTPVVNYPGYQVYTGEPFSFQAAPTYFYKIILRHIRKDKDKDTEEPVAPLENE